MKKELVEEEAGTSIRRLDMSTLTKAARELGAGAHPVFCVRICSTWPPVDCEVPQKRHMAGGMM